MHCAAVRDLQTRRQRTIVRGRPAFKGPNGLEGEPKTQRRCGGVIVPVPNEHPGSPVPPMGRRTGRASCVGRPRCTAAARRSPPPGRGPRLPHEPRGAVPAAG